MEGEKIDTFIKTARELVKENKILEELKQRNQKLEEENQELKGQIEEYELKILELTRMLGYLQEMEKEKQQHSQNNPDIIDTEEKATTVKNLMRIAKQHNMTAFCYKLIEGEIEIKQCIESLKLKQITYISKNQGLPNKLYEFENANRSNKKSKIEQNPHPENNIYFFVYPNKIIMIYYDHKKKIWFQDECKE